MRKLTFGSGCSGPGDLVWQSWRQPRPGRRRWSSLGRWSSVWSTSLGPCQVSRWQFAPEASSLCPLLSNQRHIGQLWFSLAYFTEHPLYNTTYWKLCFRHDICVRAPALITISPVKLCTITLQIVFRIKKHECFDTYIYCHEWHMPIWPQDRISPSVQWLYQSAKLARTLGQCKDTEGAK